MAAKHGRMTTNMCKTPRTHTEQCDELCTEALKGEVITPHGEQHGQGQQVEGLAMLNWSCCPVMDEGMAQATDDWVECGLDAQRLIEDVDGSHHHVDGGCWVACGPCDYFKEVGNSAGGVVSSGGGTQFPPSSSSLRNGLDCFDTATM